MGFLIVLVVLAVVVLVVTWPLWRARPAEELQEERRAFSGSVRLAELEAEREAKYRELRDAELDHRTGKLSDEDFEAVNRMLRAEAVEILHAIDREAEAQSAPSGYHRSR